MNLERRMADEAARPAGRNIATVQGGAAMATLGVGGAISNPNEAGTYWWQIGIPTITLGTHPHPFPS